MIRLIESRCVLWFHFNRRSIDFFTLLHQTPSANSLRKPIFVQQFVLFLFSRYDSVDNNSYDNYLKKIVSFERVMKNLSFHTCHSDIINNCNSAFRLWTFLVSHWLWRCKSFYPLKRFRLSRHFSVQLRVRFHFEAQQYKNNAKIQLIFVAQCFRYFQFRLHVYYKVKHQTFQL